MSHHQNNHKNDHNYHRIYEYMKHANLKQLTTTQICLDNTINKKKKKQKITCIWKQSFTNCFWRPYAIILEEYATYIRKVTQTIDDICCWFQCKIHIDFFSYVSFVILCVKAQSNRWRYIKLDKKWWAFVWNKNISTSIYTYGLIINKYQRKLN